MSLSILSALGIVIEWAVTLPWRHGTLRELPGFVVWQFCVNYVAVFGLTWLAVTWSMSDPVPPWQFGVAFAAGSVLPNTLLRRHLFRDRPLRRPPPLRPWPAALIAALAHAVGLGCVVYP